MKSNRLLKPIARRPMRWTILSMHAVLLCACLRAAIANEAVTQRSTTGWAEAFARSPDMPARIPVHVDWADTTLPDSPVTFGAPFPRGQLTDRTALRLVDEAGREIPADIAVAATWDGPDGPVRWARIDAVVQRERRYFLTTQPPAAPEKDPAAAAVHLREDESGVTVHTGPMIVTLSRQDPAIVSGIALTGDDGREIVSATRAALDVPSVRDAEGILYRAGGGNDGLRLDVVEAGEQRAVIRREGWYVNDQGHRFCRFITYTYFHAGQAAFRHDHTLVVAFDTQQHQIRNIQLPLPLNLGARTRAVFATDTSPTGNPVERDPAAGPVRLLQDAHDHWTLGGGGHGPAEGRRAGGWFGMADEHVAALVGMTDFWQQHPGQLEADGDVLRLHLWPDAGVDALDFRPSAVMGDLYPGDHVFHARWYEDGLDEMTQAWGLAKTHSLQFAFSSADRIEETTARIRAMTVTPVLAHVDPAWACATEAFGRVHPRDPDRFPELEAILDALIHRKLWLREELGEYGWIDFGDTHYRYPPSLWRRWASMFYGFPNVLPRLYLRSGDRRLWDFHRVNAKHIMDIDLCHLDHDGFGKTRGLRYGGDGGIAHYAAGLYGITCDTHLNFMLMDYYLNGNLRAREVAETYARAHANLGDTATATGYNGRNTGGALRLYAEAWQATWDPVYLTLMRQVAEVLIAEWEVDGFARHLTSLMSIPYSDVYMNEGILLYIQLTGDERMRTLFLDIMDLYNRRRDIRAPVGTTMSGLIHAWWFTGDTRYLPFMLWQKEAAIERVPVTGAPSEIGAISHHDTATLGYQLPVVMAALAAADHLPEPDGFPPPKGHPFTLESNGAFYLEKRAGRALDARVEVNLHRRYRNRLLARRSTFPNWDEWTARLSKDASPALLLFGPDGEIVERLDLQTDTLLQEAVFHIPAEAPAGAYAVAPAALVTPLFLRLTDTTARRRVVQAGETWIRDGENQYFFLVPAGTNRFRVLIKNDITRADSHVTVRDDQNRTLAEQSWSGTSPEHRVMEIDAGEPEGDRVYRIVFSSAQKPAHFIRLDGVPSFLAAAPEELFTPAWRHRLPEAWVPREHEQPVYLDAELPWGAPALWLPQGAAVQIASPDPERPLLDPAQGTVELWIRPVGAWDNLQDRDFLRCGLLHIWRRSVWGIYVNLRGALHNLRDFVVPMNRWIHLAVAWQPADEGGTVLSLFADGIRVGEPARVEEAGRWTDSVLSIPAGDLGLFVAGLRASDTTRYTENFDPPADPFTADANTTVLAAFDGDGRALVFGEWQPLELQPPSRPQSPHGAMIHPLPGT